jgi:hypothetical protein
MGQTLPNVRSRRIGGSAPEAVVGAASIGLPGSTP